MRLLVLGGSAFLSRAVAELAVAQGYDVTCANRGLSGTVPDGATHLVWDRSTGEPPPEAESFDVVLDVSDRPGQVRRALAHWPDAHWIFVSTINVFADPATPGSDVLQEPVDSDEPEPMSAERYGGMKVACEQAVAATATSWQVVRPGLIVGPGDLSGRFAYWPARLAEAGFGPVLAPGTPEDPVQFIDVRDLAAWLVRCAAARQTGTFVATGRSLSRGEALARIAEGVGTHPAWTWLPADRLAQHDVLPWSGPRSVPLWLPLPDYAAMCVHDVGPAFVAGLETRPIEETARDTLAWLEATPDAEVTGLTRAEEIAVLAEWDNSPLDA